MILLPPLMLDERRTALGAMAWEQTAFEMAWGLLCRDAPPASVHGMQHPVLGQAGWALRGLCPIVHRVDAWRQVDVDGFSDGWHVFLHAQTLRQFIASGSPASNGVLGHLGDPKHTFSAWMIHLARAVVHQATGRGLMSQGHPPTTAPSGIALTADQWEIVANDAPEQWLLETCNWPRHPSIQREATPGRINDWMTLLGEETCGPEMALAQWWRWNKQRRQGPAPSAQAWMAPWAGAFRTQAKPAEVEMWSWAARRRLDWMHQHAQGWVNTQRRDALLALALAERDDEMTTRLLEVGARAQSDALFYLKQPHLIAPLIQAGALLDATNQDGTVVQWAARTAPQTVPTLLDLGAPLGDGGMMGLAHRLCVRPDALFEEWQHAMMAVCNRRDEFKQEAWWKQSRPLVWLLDNAVSDTDIAAKAAWLKTLGMEWPEEADACQAMKGWLEHINTADSAQQANKAYVLGQRLTDLCQKSGFNLAAVNAYGQNVLHIVFAFCTRPDVIKPLAHSLVGVGVDLLQEDQGGHAPHAQPLVPAHVLNTLKAPLADWVSQSRAKRLNQVLAETQEEAPKRKRF